MKKWIKPLLFTLGGGIAGFLYSWFVGCASGTCAITSDPALSAVYMAVIGLLLSFVFRKERSCKCNTQ